MSRFWVLRDVFHEVIPSFRQAQIVSVDVTEVVSAERRSDLMALFKGKGWEIAVIIEAQRHRDPRKQLVWPVYVARVRSRYGCPTWLLIVTTDPAMVDWCDAPMMS